MCQGGADRQAVNPGYGQTHAPKAARKLSLG
jgi:hypothetical protein